MKKLKIIALTLICVGTLLAIEPVYLNDREANIVDPGQVHTPRNRWVVIDTTTSAGDEPTDLAVGERTYQTVVTAIATDSSGDGEISCYDVPRSWNVAKFRGMGITNDGDVVHQIYLGTLGDGNRHTDSTSADCELTYAGQLAWVVGTQASITSTYEMADALTITSDTSFVKSWSSTSPGGNRVAEATLDLDGADLIVVVTTTADCDCKLSVKGR